MILMAGAMLFVACQKDGENLVDLTAVVSDQPTSNSKVYLDGNLGYWQHGDQVMINGANETYNKYTLSVQTDGSTTAKILNVVKDENDKYTAAYPASQVSAITNGTSVTMTIPQKQTYQLQTNVYEGTADSQHVEMPMVAYSNDGSSLKFYNAASLIRLNLVNNTGKDFQIHYVTVTADNSYISGTGTVSVAGLVANPQTLPSFLVTEEDAEKSVTLDCCDAHPLVENGKNIILYLVVAPFGSNESRDQLNVTVMAEDGDNKKYTFNVDSRASGLYIERGQIGAVKVTMTAGLGTQSEFWGQGTKDCPYLITSKADLIQLRNIVDYISPYNNASYQSKYNTAERHFRQTVDIDLSDQTTWGADTSRAVGCSTYFFKANYDGRKKYVKLEISNLGTTISAFHGLGLFGTVGGGGSIKNLLVKGTISANASRQIRIGAIAGDVKGSFTFENCSSEVPFSTVNNQNLREQIFGGICGYIDASGCTVTIKDCTNSGSLQKYYGTLGGICGYVKAGTVSFIGDTNTGVITHSYSATTNEQYSGGICGYTYVATTFSKCANDANLTGEAAYFGGILGRSKTANSYTDCTNSKLIECTSVTGGIVGYEAGSSIFTGCSNTGSISGSGDEIAGLIGHAASSIELHDGCINTGAVSSTDGSLIGGLVGYAENEIYFEGTITNTGRVSGKDNVGGFLGKTKKSLTFKKNAIGENSGTVTGRNDVGGIAGYVTETFWLNNGIQITNSGRVKATAKTVGGFVGRAKAVTESAESKGISYTLWNRNNSESDDGYGVSGTDSVGGFFGKIINASTIGGSSINSAYVSGSNYVGGIVAYITGLTTMSGSCSNSGTITCSTNYCGGIIGYAYGGLTVSSGTVTNSGPISGAAYLGGIIGYTNNALTISANTVSNSGSVTGTGSPVGGIVGNAAGTKASTLNSVTNSGNITGNSNVGGIIGVISGAADRTIISSTNSGSVHGALNYVGGIVGSFGVDGYRLTLRGCKNILNSSSSNDISGSSYVGGIYGAGRCVTITNCANYTPVSGKIQYIGGIVGALNNKIGTSYIDTCLNTGAVSSSRTGSTESQCGGIIGNIAPNATSTLYIRNCVNKGNVSAPNAGSGINGGLIGLINNTSVTVNLNNCYSEGAISGKSYTSGLVGKRYNGTLTVNNCYFNGTVSCGNATYGYALGYGTATWTNCYAVYGTAAKPYSGTTAGLASGTKTNCALFKASDGTFTTTGNDNITVGSYSTLGDALRAWQGAHSDYHIAWKTDDAIPTLNNTLFQ